MCYQEPPRLLRLKRRRKKTKPLQESWDQSPRRTNTRPRRPWSGTKQEAKVWFREPAQRLPPKPVKLRDQFTPRADGVQPSGPGREGELRRGDV